MPKLLALLLKIRKWHNETTGTCKCHGESYTVEQYNLRITDEKGILSWILVNTGDWNSVTKICVSFFCIEMQFNQQTKLWRKGKEYKNCCMHLSLIFVVYHLGYAVVPGQGHSFPVWRVSHAC